MQVTRGLEWLFSTLIALICAALSLFLALLACNNCVLSSVYRPVSENEVFPFNGIALHELADEYSSSGAQLLSPVVVWVLWGLPFLCALLSFAWRGMPKRSQVSCRSSDDEEATPRLRRIARLAGRGLRYHLPPRALWAWLCDGLAVYDALIVATWLALNVLYIQQRYALLSSASISQHAGHTKAQARWMLLGAGCGWACCLNIMLLMFPVPRSTFLHWLTGTSFPTLIQYHRWLGHGTMLVVCLHALGYCVKWLTQGAWTAGLTWNAASTNVLAGIIAWLCGCALWASSVSWVRRRFYEVFHRMHMVFGTLFIIFMLMHDIKLWIYAIPGMLFYLLDLQLRLVQRSQPVQLRTLTSAGHEGLVALQLHADSRWPMRPVQELFIRAAAVSRMQWHPFTVIHGEQPHTYVAHVKAAGSWTRDFISRLTSDGHVEVRVDGPYGEDFERPKWGAYEVLVIFAGGIGVTPVLGILLDIARRRQLPHREKLWPKKVHLTYAMHHKEEATLLERPSIARAIQEGWLEVAVHYTGGAKPSMLRIERLASTEELALPKRFSGDSVEELHQVRSTTASSVKTGEATGQSTPVKRVAIPPYHYDVSHWAAAHVLCFLGALLGAWGALEYEAAQHARTRGQYRAPDWAVSLLLFVATCTGSMLLPLSVLIIPSNIMRWYSGRLWPTSRAAAALDGTSSLERSEQGKGGPQEAVAEDGSEPDLEAAPPDLPLQYGRPNVPAVLAAHLKAHADISDIAVFVAGPDGMVTDVMRACMAHNDAVGLRGRPWAHAMQHTYNL